MYKYVHCRKIYNLSVLALEQVNTQPYTEEWENKLLIHETENNKTNKQHHIYKKFSISIAYCMYKNSYIDNVYGT
jgi:hypothetical protein